MCVPVSKQEVTLLTCTGTRIDSFPGRWSPVSQGLYRYSTTVGLTHLHILSYGAVKSRWWWRRWTISKWIHGEITALPWRRTNQVYAERWYTSILQWVKLKTETASVAVLYNIRVCNAPRARIGDRWPSPLRHAWFRRNQNRGMCFE